MWQNFLELERPDRPRPQRQIERPVANQELVDIVEELLTLNPRQSLRNLAKRLGRKYLILLKLNYIE